jgi:hypothetical protein
VFALVVKPVCRIKEGFLVIRWSVLNVAQT